jgi:hypothetical protein
MRNWARASFGAATFAGTMLAQTLPAHATEVSRTLPFERAVYRDEALCGQVAIFWDNPQYGNVPYASAQTLRVPGTCTTDGAHNPGVGPLDTWVTLQQAYALTSIECGTTRVRENTNSNFQWAYNWAGCPTDGPHWWRALGSYGGQLHERYYNPQDVFPQPTEWILK